MKKDKIEEMLEKLEKISKENSIILIKKNFEPKDEEVFITSSELAFECPLSKSVIEIPVRSSDCTHMNCFDGYSFLSMNRTNPKFVCPICEKKISFSSLRVDSYIQDIINSAKSNYETDSVHFNKDGSYFFVNKKRVNEDSSDSSSKKPKIFLDLTL